jgi:hypothetical protein
MLAGPRNSLQKESYRKSNRMMSMRMVTRGTKQYLVVGACSGRVPPHAAQPPEHTRPRPEAAVNTTIITKMKVDKIGVERSEFGCMNTWGGIK